MKKRGLSVTENTLVHWNDWNTAAFSRAKREKKPILLAISATWCHWCHTMDRNTYGNPDMARFIDEHFVPIRVDTDRRPDVNARYNLGGWPTTAVLSSDGALVTGVLYAPPEQLRPFLEHVLKVFRERQAVLPTVKPQHQQCTPADTKPLLNEVFAALQQSYDPKYGGFGTEPKFIQHDLLRFLLALTKHEKHGEDAREMLAATLTNMAKGQLYDNEEGGFYRYATRQDWSQPHWEKMLEDNAQLIETYHEASRVLKKPAFKNIAEQTTAFVLDTFFDEKTGTFFASQDADEEYCLLALGERKKRAAPAIDKTIYADKNALMITALFTTGKEQIAEKALAGLKKLLSTRKGIMHCAEKIPQALSWLPDHVALLKALVAGRKHEDAKKLVRQMQTLFSDRSGIFYDVPADKDALGLLKHRVIDFEANAELALLLLEIGMKPLAERVLRCIASQAQTSGAHAATYALAVDRLRKV